MRASHALAAAALVLAACSRDAAEPDRAPPAPPRAAVAGFQPGAVYVLSNAAANEVLVFERDPAGALSPAGAVATGGAGTGGGLGSQGAIVLSANRNWLLAVDAGSDEISVFRVWPNGLQQTDRVASGGDMPISVTIDGSLVYALNAGGAGNVTGFRLGVDGRLTPIPGSTRPLGGTAPAQVQLSPDGRVLVVTLKGTSQIATYTVDADGIATGPTLHASSGATPFGFAFSSRITIVVSEAFGGAPDASAVSSYRVSRAGTPRTVSASVGTTETAACWIVITRDGRYAYTTNTGSGSITGYAVGPAGKLTILDADGRTGLTGAGSGPIDAELSDNSRFLYVLNGGTHTISGFAVESDGALTPLAGGGAGGLPAAAVGLAAR